MIKYIKWLFVLVSFAMCASGNEITPEMEEENIVPEDSIEILPTKKLTYLALGDSYTIGEAVPVSERYPMQLVAKALSEKYDVEQPVIIARTGWTTAELKQGMAAANIAGNKYDMVSLLIGVNNQFRGQDVQIYIREFDELLRMAIDFADGNKDAVFVVSIPDWGVTPFALGRDREKIAREIDVHNSINKNITEGYGISYFNITPISREAADDLTLLASDRLHPSGKMYKRWVDEVIYNTFKQKLDTLNSR